MSAKFGGMIGGMEGERFITEKEDSVTPTIKMFLHDMELAGFEGDQYRFLQALVTQPLHGVVKIELENRPTVLIDTASMRTHEEMASVINRSLGEMFELMTPNETDRNVLPTISFIPTVLH